MNEMHRTPPAPGQYLCFEVNQQIYGVDIQIVHEINRPVPLTEIPEAPAFVLGLMNLRGKLIPVIDLRTKLGIARVAATKQTCNVVVDTEWGQVGMIVDAIRGVSDFALEELEGAPSFGEVAASSHVRGLAKHSTGVTILLSVQSLLSTDVWKHVDKSLKAAA